MSATGLPTPIAATGSSVTVLTDRVLEEQQRRTVPDTLQQVSGTARRLLHGVKVAALCPAGQALSHRYTSVEHGLALHRYWTNVCSACAMKGACTTGKEHRLTRWEHEDVLEAVHRRLDGDPLVMRVRRETVEHPSGTLKARMGATHLLTKTLPRVSTEMASQILAYDLTRVLTIMGSLWQRSSPEQGREIAC